MVRLRCALDPSLDVSQYAHTAWKIRDGFTPGTINAIAQTPDGYLWLGTELGLVRFDGVRAVPWHPPSGQQLPADRITSLLAARDGTLWIATQKGPGHLEGQQAYHLSAAAGADITRVLVDRQRHSVGCRASLPPPGKLCAFRDGSVQCYGEDGSLGIGVRDLYEDQEG